MINWIQRCSPFVPQFCGLNHVDTLSCEAHSFCNIYCNITGIRVSPRRLSIDARLDLPENRNCAHIIATVNRVGLVLYSDCPTPDVFTNASYYDASTASNKHFPVTVALIPVDINKSPFWTELAYGLQLPEPTRHMVDQLDDLGPLNSHYFDSEVGSPIKTISQTTTMGAGPGTIVYQTGIKVLKGVKMLVFFQVIGNPTKWTLMDGCWVGFSDETAFNNYIGGRPNVIINIAAVEFQKLQANPDVFKS